MRFLAATVLLFSAMPAYAGDEVTLTVSGSPRAALEHEVRSVTLGSSWERVCVAPCRASVAREGPFRVVGLDPDARDSSAFALPRGERDVTIDINLSTRGKRDAGIVGLVLSASALAFGLGTLIAGAAMNGAFNLCWFSPCAKSHDGDPVLVAGGALSISGLMGVLIGAVLIHVNRATTVQVGLSPASMAVFF